MLNRSKTFEQAALHTLSIYRYNACATFFFYSVLQRMMYALAHCSINPLPYDQQNPLNEDLYLKISNEICNRIKNNPREAKAIEELFQKLHEYRISADYGNDKLVQDDAVECRAIQESLISKLNRFFPIKDS